MTEEPVVRFYAGAPLVYRHNVRLGSLCLLDHHPRVLSPGAEAELARMADDVVGLITEHEYTAKFAGRWQ